MVTREQLIDWPAMMPSLVSTKTGLLNPNSAMLAAI